MSFSRVLNISDNCCEGGAGGLEKKMVPLTKVVPFAKTAPQWCNSPIARPPKEEGTFK